MQDLNPQDGDDAESTVFRDVILLALLGFVTIVVLLLPHVRPPVEAKEATERPGDIMVEARWPDDLDTDVDLWIEAPGDRPVGYSNRGGQYFNLLRDDLGHSNDVTKLNYEFAFSRGAPQGEYTVNLHLYRNVSKAKTIPVTVAITLQNTNTQMPQLIARESIVLEHEGQEVTVVRFIIGRNGYLAPGSIHYRFKELRSGDKS
jgi:hypothetical protein